MAQRASAEDEITEMMHHLGTCDIEDLTRRCSNLTWNQIFLVIDRLSRTGQVKLAHTDRGRYTLTLLRQQERRPDQQSLPS